MKDITRYLTVFFALIPLSALVCNVIELPARFNLSKDNYLSIQSFTSEFSWLIVFEFAAMFMTIVLIVAEKKKRQPFRLLLMALICFVISIAIFFIFNLPADIATNGWLNLPPDWFPVRDQWEYANAVRAIFSFTGFTFIVLALVKNRHYYRVYA